MDHELTRLNTSYTDDTSCGEQQQQENGAAETTTDSPTHAYNVAYTLKQSRLNDELAVSIVFTRSNSRVSTTNWP